MGRISRSVIPIAARRGAAQLSTGLGGIVLPLPSGEWKLIALGESRTVIAHVPRLGGRFASTKLDTQKRPHMLITFEAAAEGFDGGWKVPALCEDRSLHHKVPADRGNNNRDYRKFQCWGIKEQTMKPAANTLQWLNDSYEWIGKNSAGMPLTMIRVAYYQGDGPKFLRAEYAFNPERDGFARQGSVEWRRDRIISNGKKVKYIESLKTWGAEWAPKVEQGFAGKTP